MTGPKGNGIDQQGSIREGQTESGTGVVMVRIQ